MSLSGPARAASLASKHLVGIAALIALVALLAVAQPAGAVTIGSDLSANAGSSGPCNAPCDWVPTEEHAVLVPTGGVITTWRFKEFDINDLKGEVFRLVVLKGNTVVAMDSQVLPSMPAFQQNIYEFKTSIPVSDGERLGLEIPSFVAVWAFNTDPSFYGDLFWEPALALGETREPSAANVHNEHELLLNADIGAPSPPPGGGGSSGGGTQTGQVKFLNGGPNPTILTSNNRAAGVPTVCELPPGSPFTCSGAVVFRSVSAPTSAEPGQHARAAAKPKGTLLGKGTFKIAPGKTKKVKVKLTSNAAAALKKTGKLKGSLTATSALIDGTKSPVTQKLTIKLKGFKPKHR